MATAQASPVSPSPTIPKSLLEQVTGCQVLTHLIEDGSKPGDNYMSVIYSVTAEVIPPGESSKETRHYLFKCYPQHPARQVYLNKTNMFHNELCFYSIWVKALMDFQTAMLEIPENNIITLSIPPYVGGKAINFSEVENPEENNSKVYLPTDNFIVLTDLRRTWGYKMMDKTVSLEFDCLRLTVSELAKVHALSWAYKQKVEWDILKKFPFLKCAIAKDDMLMWSKIVSQNAQIAIKTMDAALGQGNHLSQSTSNFDGHIEKLVELFLDQTEDAERESWNMHRLPPKDMVKASENEKLWRVILHGDTWCNNLLFKINETSGKPENVMLFDFQLTREGCPTADLVYLIYTSTTADFRRRHLQETLQIYHDKFNEVCTTLKVDSLPDFNMEVLNRRFHRSKLMGYMMAVTAFPMMLKESDKAVANLEHVDEKTKIGDMLSNAFADGLASDLYKTRILEIARELYDEGVI